MRDKQLHRDGEKGLDTGTAHLAAPDPLRDQSFLAVASALSLPGTCPAGKVAQPPGPDHCTLSVLCKTIQFALSQWRPGPSVTSLGVCPLQTNDAHLRSQISPLFSLLWVNRQERRGRTQGQKARPVPVKAATSMGIFSGAVVFSGAPWAQGWKAQTGSLQHVREDELPGLLEESSQQGL